MSHGGQGSADLSLVSGSHALSREWESALPELHGLRLQQMGSQKKIGLTHPDDEGKENE